MAFMRGKNYVWTDGRSTYFNNNPIKNSVLEEFVVMKSPLLWSDVVYSSGSADEFKETEMQEIGNWKIYKLGEAQIGENTLISIPQAESDGWIMINNLKAYDLVEGDNNLKIFIEYKDKRGNKYTISEAVTLKLNHLNIWQKIVSKVNYYLNLLSSAVENAYISPIYK